MKRIAITIFAIGLLTSAIGQQLTTSVNALNKIVPENAAFDWSSLSFDFGKIKMGTPVTHEFKFTNKGTAPLIISSVKASCGCTVTSYSKDPIPTDLSGFVKATYNAARIGQFTKTVVIHANTAGGTVQLTIKGEVVN